MGSTTGLLCLLLVLPNWHKLRSLYCSHITRYPPFFGCDCLSCSPDGRATRRCVHLEQQDFDRQVKRTRFRPLARREVSTTQAILFSLFLMGLLGALYIPFPSASRNYGGLTTLILCVYPLAKGITNLPQIILGL
jgi:hypothetical protein